MLYFDTNYLVRLYLDEPGADLVRALAEGHEIASSVLGRIESVAAIHRTYREQKLTSSQYQALLDEFKRDDAENAFVWLLGGNELFPILEKIYRKAPPTLFLRAADALHLACAREHGFKEIYSNDKRMLEAAPLFGLKAKNVIK